jgi:hypothetical protein
VVSSHAHAADYARVLLGGPVHADEHSMLWRLPAAAKTVLHSQGRGVLLLPDAVTISRLEALLAL